MDSDFENFIDNYAKEFNLSDEQIQKLNRVRYAINRYVDEHTCYENPEVIVNDPAWFKIREMAKDALEALGIKKYLDPSKDILKSSLLSNIYVLSSPESQERIWIKERRSGENPFQEHMERFFEDCEAEEIINNHKDYEITDEQYRFLKQLYDALALYRKKRDEEEDLKKVLDDPDWHMIQVLAKKVLKVFNFKRS